MRHKKLDIKGFSLLEILLASIIFIISIGGIFVTISAVRKPVMDKESFLAGTVFGKQVLEALRTKVDATIYYTTCSPLNINGDCPNFDLSLGDHQVPVANLPSGLSWPTNISGSNTCPSVGGACLTYSVCCSDSTKGCADPSRELANCASVGSDMPREITLTINWPGST